MGDWQNGLFGCFGNCGLCLITYIAPCYTAGKNAEAVGESCCYRGCLFLLGPIGLWSAATIRSKIREQKGIEGSFMMDCIMHWICPVCTLIQEAQEVQVTTTQAMIRA